VEGVVPLEQLDDLGHERPHPGHARFDVDQVDAASRSYQRGQVIHDGLLTVTVVREDVTQHGDIVGSRIQSGRVGLTHPRAGPGQALGGDHRIGPVDGVEVRVDPGDGPLGADDTGHRDHGGTGPQPTSTTWAPEVIPASRHSSDSDSRTRCAIP
jgi:hypothetical protein